MNCLDAKANHCTAGPESECLSEEQIDGLYIFKSIKKIMVLWKAYHSSQTLFGPGRVLSKYIRLI